MLGTVQGLIGGIGYYVVPFLLMITPIVFFHELGHFLVARACGVRIETFSIGFGPEIFGWHDRAGTRWKVAWIPLGGYVKMHGQERPEEVPEEVRASWKPGQTFHDEAISDGRVKGSRRRTFRDYGKPVD